MIESNNSQRHNSLMPISQHSRFEIDLHMNGDASHFTFSIFTGVRSKTTFNHNIIQYFYSYAKFFLGKKFETQRQFKSSEQAG